MDKRYLFQFILGGTLFVLIYHFSKKNNTVISSIIPALPIVFLTGFFYLTYFNADVNNYIKNCIYTFGSDVIFFIIFYILANNILKNILFSFIISITLYFILLYFLIKNNILK